MIRVTFFLVGVEMLPTLDILPDFFICLLDAGLGGLYRFIPEFIAFRCPFGLPGLLHRIDAGDVVGKHVDD
jgi:hypothetical protein